MMTTATKINLRDLTISLSLIMGFTLYFSSYSEAQSSYHLNPDLQGYQNCGPMDNPIKCLENTIASIDADEGFYSSFDEIKKGIYKAEYYIQLAYIYRQLNNKKIEVENLHQAQRSLFSIHGNDNLGSTRADWLRDMILSQLKDHCKDPLPEYKNLCDSLIRLMEPKVDLVEANTHDAEVDFVSSNERSKSTYTESKLNSYLLESLQSYMKKHPLSREFTSLHASDSCILEIRRKIDPNVKVLDCYLAHSLYTDELGEQMMGISKEIDYSRITNVDKIDMTILFKPNKSDEITLKNGVFYVYYKD